MKSLNPFASASQAAKALAICVGTLLSGYPPLSAKASRPASCARVMSFSQVDWVCAAVSPTTTCAKASFWAAVRPVKLLVAAMAERRREVVCFILVKFFFLCAGLDTIQLETESRGQWDVDHIYTS